jgi:hypothetical protein
MVRGKGEGGCNAALSMSQTDRPPGGGGLCLANPGKKSTLITVGPAPVDPGHPSCCHETFGPPFINLKLLVLAWLFRLYLTLPVKPPFQLSFLLPVPGRRTSGKGMGNRMGKKYERKWVLKWTEKSEGSLDRK